LVGFSLACALFAAILAQCVVGGWVGAQSESREEGSFDEWLTAQVYGSRGAYAMEPHFGGSVSFTLLPEGEPISTRLLSQEQAAAAALRVEESGWKQVLLMR
jgi:hypothetical protein